MLTTGKRENVYLALQHLCKDYWIAEQTDRMKWKQQSSFDLFAHYTNKNYLTYETKGITFIDVISWMILHHHFIPLWIPLHYCEMYLCIIALSVVITFTYDFELRFVYIAKINCRPKGVKFGATSLGSMADLQYRLSFFLDNKGKHSPEVHWIIFF